MQLQRYADPTQFRADNDAFLLAQAASCSYMFANTRTLTAAQVAERKLWLARLHRDGVTCAVAVITSAPPMRLLGFSEFDDDAAALLVAALHEDGVQPDGGTGDVDSACRIATCLGVQTSERFRMGNHVLDGAPVIAMCAGRMRSATMADYDLVLAWEDAFIRECGLPYHRAALEAAIRDRLSAPSPLEWLWEDEGEPVAKALGRPTPPIARIGMVYTAPGRRGKGYAGALVGTLSAALQAQACPSVFLATDMANPTSNGVYCRIGYRFTGEATHLDFLRDAAPPSAA
jgi:ribosomal protein S18 acetylase RimI-like enzyme